MILMRFIKKIPASLAGIGGPYQPGQEYPLPDQVALGLIATKDRDWEEVKSQQNNSDESSSSNGEVSWHKGRK